MAKLTPTSYIVLGLVSWAGEATPYDLKRIAAGSVGNIWSVPHSQLYSEPERLARAGYLSRQQERGGRRRKRYAVTERGRKALDEWASTPTDDLPELRDAALLKLLFGGDPRILAPAQRDAHRRRLEVYEALRALGSGQGPPGLALLIEGGIVYEREWIRYWSGVLGE